VNTFRNFIPCLVLLSTLSCTVFFSCDRPSNILETGESGLVLRTDSTIVKVSFCNPSVVRVQKSPEDRFSTRESLSVINRRIAPVDFRVEQDENQTRLISSGLEVAIGHRDGQVTYFTPGGELILTEKESDYSTFLPVNTRKDTAYHIQQQFEITPSEALYGLGQYQYGSMNYRGESLSLWQGNKVAVVPFMVSSKGYGILWDNYSHTRFGIPHEPQPVPADHLYDENGNKGGLSGDYFPNMELKGPGVARLDPTVNMDMRYKPPKGVEGNEYLKMHPLPAGISPEALSIRWQGEIKTDMAGVYHFFLPHDDGTRLWVNDKQIIDAWEYGESNEMGKIQLEANKRYNIRLEWFNKTWGGKIILKWLPPSPQYENTFSFWSGIGDEIDYYFVHGPGMDTVIAGYRELTGQAPMFGKWAYGLWQCKEHYHTQEELLGVASEYRKRGIPLDNIVQDWFYWDPHPWGSHAFDSARYPDPKGMIDNVHSLDLHFMISVWPKFDEGSENYQALNKKGYLYDTYDDVPEWNPQAYYDAFDPGARQMYWEQLRDSLFVKGVDAWWLDATEPEISKPHTPEAIKQRMDNYLGSGVRYLNAYSLLTTQGVYQGQREETEDKRVFILTRSTFAGQQRHAATTWSGDISASWNVFRKQISAGLNFSISGIPYWTTDIGGFFVNYPDPGENPEYEELFTRWFQYGAFCPIFRVHGTHLPREMWEFGDESYNVQLLYDNLRYRLMPYIYSLAGKTTHQHYTIMRPLVMDFGDDEKVLDIPDQYMFGPAFLVNPVTTYRARQRELYLPRWKGGWYNFWTGEQWEGENSMVADAPLETLPLFVKAGSIVPMGPFLQYAQEKPADSIELRIYPGSDGSFALYEDENDGYGYEKGQYANVPIEWDDKERSLVIGTRKGNFPGMLKERTFDLVIVEKGQGIGITTTSGKQVVYNGEEITINFE